ncbi:MAG: hypothetical protein KAR38_02090, partial [Calditrichia bacterium]|nr:hypothetical protein [Calditrichia bacterium]
MRQFKSITLICLSGIIIFISNYLNAQVISQDSLALVDFYTSTNGGSWTDNSDWLSSPVSEWNGITVENNRVTKIELYNNGLSGELPGSIGNLTKLRVLNLYNNEIAGQIPNGIGLLNSLKYLYLYQNQLTGDLPLQINNLDSLIRIRLYDNELLNLPDLSTSDFAETIVELRVENNKLTFEDLEPNIEIAPT